MPQFRVTFADNLDLLHFIENTFKTLNNGHRFLLETVMSATVTLINIGNRSDDINTFSNHMPKQVTEFHSDSADSVLPQFESKGKRINDFKDILNVFTILKPRKKVYVILFFNMYILKVYTIQMLTKFPSDKINGTKNALFFFFFAPTDYSFLLVCDSYMILKVRVSKNFCGILISSFVFLFIKVHKYLTLKHHNSFQN